MIRLFLPQPLLEEWALDERADLKEGHLVVAQEQSRYPVVPAVLFSKLVSGVDSHGLLSKVKTESQLRDLGGEQMADSVIIGDNAYEVVPGYVTEVGPPQGRAKTPGESELLAAYFLDKIGS